MSVGPFELLVLLVVLLLVVGPTVLPRITRNLGKSVGSFQQGMRDHDDRVAERPVEGTLERTAPPAGSPRAELPPRDGPSGEV
ncbi:MAG: twin-arginine translocase TatA/TatE family subunit [Deltaproteobacteria bacterium]|nr:twin-arginine translocase TatA/TatE family subunit [Deltaproteobacteria bacterium]